MADRSVSVTLRANVGGYLAGMSAARKATRDLAQDTLKATTENHRNLQAVGRSGLIAGGAVAAGLAVAVRAAAQFDKSMSGVKSVLDEVGQHSMPALRKAAIDAGRATVFSASEAAQAEAELAKAGVSAGDILSGGLTGALSLAAAGQLDLADAATIAAQAMNIFKLRGDQVGHVADVLAAGANKSAADVGQLGDALRQGGLVASQLGINLEDTVGALSAFADRALIGSDGGTAFKTMLQRLTPSSKEASDAMSAIGFSAFDASGNFVGLAKVAEGLQKGLGTLSAEQRAATLNTIFGSDAVRAANVLYEQGAAGIDEYSRAVNDSGAAQRMAATQLDNLSGDLEQLKGSIETALIQSGSAGNDSLRSLTQTATGAVNAFSNLPGVVQKVGFFGAAISSGALLAVGAIGTLLPKVRAGREALRSLGAAGEIADRGLGKFARGAAKASLAAAAIAAIGQSFNGVNGDFRRFEESVEATAGDGTQAKIAALRKEMERLKEVAGGGITIGGTTIRPLDFTGGKSAAADKADALADRIKELRHEQDLADASAKNSTTTQKELANAYENQTIPAVQDATDALDAYNNALDASTAAIDAYTSQAELAKSFKDLSKEIKTAGEVTNAEKLALGGFASDVVSTTKAVLDQTNNQHKANEAMREGRKQFIDLAEQAGYSASQARKLANRLLEIPARTDIDINAQAIDDALAKTRHLVRLLEKVGVSRSVGLGIANKTASQGGALNRAAGGIIPGPPSTSDTVPAWLSTGEFVVNAHATRANRSLLEAINGGGAQRFSQGGIVGPSTGSYTQQITVVAPDPVAAGESVARRGRNEAWKAGWPVP